MIHGLDVTNSVVDESRDVSVINPTGGDRLETSFYVVLEARKWAVARQQCVLTTEELS